MAASDYHLKIDGIPGESTDSKHANEIDITAFSWGVVNHGSTGQGGGGGSGKSTANDFTFSKPCDKASPLLMAAAATGKHIPKVVLSVRKASGQGGQADYLVITFEAVFVSSYSTAASGDALVHDSFSLNVGKVTFEYKPQNADGTLGGVVPANYDWTRNESK
ncbi:MULTISPECIES: Hcp family type VI secretion system effector [Stenotrophomonas]|uniref:Hcp1 family type VI secretion system effector n=1 Tax=Stenotrophomonas nitritireducens TaxID=83617 RepID=A0ABR5NH85_9GAMM|nr:MULTISPECIES: type VI secretion system tube protein Hcp [Stenotrophomonas]KQN98457.1 hypothetical protein ASF01_11560 [Stenotrophomonas sp. Leaf70]KRG55490.1 hypothetical protein ABB22_14050 [Stenotrophomonas nitritireducens]MBN8769810.1 type VI secretion system tube protein Hcp [Stenotrophomonas sp.]MBN8790725.1 type VI secretion system tube protein Hcp [Stenotrophomonas nitritireducens]